MIFSSEETKSDEKVTQHNLNCVHAYTRLFVGGPRGQAPGVRRSGEQSLLVDGYDLPTGVYIMMVYNERVFSQRKVVINQE